MIHLRKTLVLSVILSFLSLQAQEWKVKSVKGVFLLKSEKRGQIYSIQSDGGMPAFIKEERFAKGLNRIIYQSGVVGTSELYRIERALLINQTTGKVYGDFPYRAVKLDQTGQEVDVSKTSWSFEENVLRIKDESQGLDKSLEIKL